MVGPRPPCPQSGCSGVPWLPGRAGRGVTNSGEGRAEPGLLGGSAARAVTLSVPRPGHLHTCQTPGTGLARLPVVWLQPAGEPLVLQAVVCWVSSGHSDCVMGLAVTQTTACTKSQRRHSTGPGAGLGPALARSRDLCSPCSEALGGRARSFQVVSAPGTWVKCLSSGQGGRIPARKASRRRPSQMADGIERCVKGKELFWGTEEPCPPVAMGVCVPWAVPAPEPAGPLLGQTLAMSSNS